MKKLINKIRPFAVNTLYGYRKPKDGEVGVRVWWYMLDEAMYARNYRRVIASFYGEAN